MKKQLTVALGLAVIATPVLASKARLEALGEDNYGSYYINDNRNIFLNAAKINDNKDLATYEFGASTTNAAAATQDNTSTPKAEGGVIKAVGNMVYGVHLGNSTPTAGLTRTLATGGTATGLQEQKPIDFFVGGDAGVKWGANLTYENFDGTVGTDKVKSNALRTRFGVVMGDTEAFAQISLQGNARNYTQGENIEGKSSYYLGAGHQLNSYKLFVDYKNVASNYNDVTVGGANSVALYQYREWRVGAARSEKLNDKATMYAKLMWTRTQIDDTGAAGGNQTGIAGVSTIDGATIQTVLPLTAGLEYDAASWLVLRTSASQNLCGSRRTSGVAGTSKTTATSTVVRAGASLKFGDFSVDGLVSTTADGAAPTNTSASTTNSRGGIRTDQLMTRVSMNYRF